MKTLIDVRSKTFWGAVVAIVTGVGIGVQGDWVNGGQYIVTGLLSLFVRHTVTKQ